MKKHTVKTKTQNKTKKKLTGRTAQKLTVGIDLGDKYSRYCILDEAGEIVSEGRVGTSVRGFEETFGKMAASRVAMEVGTHSPWVSRLLESYGHEVIVANARKVRLISQAKKKNDRIDAEQLARLARIDRRLLAPIQHRGEVAQADLAVIRARAEMVATRTKLINSARGLAKPMGARLAKCDADQAGEALAKELPAGVKAVVGPMLKMVEQLTEQIGVYDAQIEKIEKRYPETKLLQQVYGVGTLVSLTYVLTLEDGGRFRRSREVGPYVGLQPKQDESGESAAQLGISKAGDGLLRTLLVQSAQCMLRKGAPDSDLRAWGLGKQQRGGKNGKRRAVVAVARKLAVLLHRLWVTGEVYDPHYNRKGAEERTLAA
jgi:transposase